MRYIEIHIDGAGNLLSANAGSLMPAVVMLTGLLQLENSDCEGVKHRISACWGSQHFVP